MRANGGKHKAHFPVRPGHMPGNDADFIVCWTDIAAVGWFAQSMQPALRTDAFGWPITKPAEDPREVS